MGKLDQVNIHVTKERKLASVMIIKTNSPPGKGYLCGVSRLVFVSAVVF